MIRRPFLRQLTSLVGALALVGCARYEMKNELDVPGLCPDPASRHLPDTIETVVAGAADGRVFGRIVNNESRLPVVGANVVVPALRRGASADTLGRFQLDSIPQGSHEARVQRVGYWPRELRLIVTPDSAAALDIALRVVVIDGPCSGLTAVRVRKPWWKWW